MKNIVEKSMLGNTWVMSDDINCTGNDDLMTKILSNRGVVGAENIQKFLNPSIKEYMPDPSCLQDMDLAVEIIANSIINEKKIVIYGDYDVDGITSTAIFVKYLRELGVDVMWHVPTREGEGYGLNISAIDDIIAKGANLLITVDCGITGVSEIEYAKNKGLDIVVTDHHSPDTVLPVADALINPKRMDDESGMYYLAGVGVAFLTLVALNRKLRSINDIPDEMAKRLKNVNLMNYMDLVALGTICDTMPLIGLNRAFVATGLKVLNLRNNLGLRVLMDVAGVKKNATVYAAGFVIGPRLNAAGRLNSALPALDLLLTDNPLVAHDLAEKLNQMNQERIDIQNAIMLQATEKAKKCCESGRCSLFVCGDNWHGGVMGIIAGRLKDKYNLPSCVATKSDGVINGSGRSIKSVDLGKIIHDALAAGILDEGGGHAAAAGFSLAESKENDFCEFLEKAVSEQLRGMSSISEIIVDAELDAAGATMDFVKKLSALEPFGQGNPEPLLVLRGGILKYATIMGGGAHLRGTITTNIGTQLPFVGFNLVGTSVGDFLLDDANCNTKITLLGSLKGNEYNGRTMAQFVIEDIAV